MVDLAKASNVLVGSGLLSTKLVRREADDLETLVVVLFVHLLEAGVLGWGRSVICNHSGASQHTGEATALSQYHYEPSSCQTYHLDAVFTIRTTLPLNSA